MQKTGIIFFIRLDLFSLMMALFLFQPSPYLPELLTTLLYLKIFCWTRHSTIGHDTNCVIDQEIVNAPN